MRIRVFIASMACFSFLMISAGHAKADTVKTFTVNVASGSEAGEVFTGSLAYNSSNQLTSFTFSDPNWDSASFTDNSSSAWNNTGQGLAIYDFNGPSSFVFWFDRNTATSDDSFALQVFSTLPGVFFYGKSDAAVDFLTDGSGTFGYNSTVTPEPSSLLLLGTGLLGLAVILFRKAKSVPHFTRL